MKPRSADRTVDSVETLEGAGFLVHRPFPTRALSDFDPFLLLDEMGPMDLGPGQAKGAPDHPHRGFETVTYMLSGRMEHRDSRGNSGKLGPGDVQWMTAGGGVVHSEMPEAEFQRTGGRMHGFQLWVNLPRRDKMIPPRYQEFPGSKIPVVKRAGVTARVIAGEALGARAVIETRTPIMYLHLTLEPGATFEQPVPKNFSVFAYLIAEHQMQTFRNDGEGVLLSAGASPLEVLLIGGEPLREPIARYGPFVMNTQAEIVQAFEDYKSGRMGAIDLDREQPFDPSRRI